MLNSNFQPNQGVRTITPFSKIGNFLYKVKIRKLPIATISFVDQHLGFILRVWVPKRVLNSNFQPNPRVRTITLFSKIKIYHIRSKSENCQLPPFRSWTSTGLHMSCVGPQEGVKFQFSAKSKGAHHYTFLKNRNFVYKVKNQKIANCHHFVRGPALGFIWRVWDPKRVLNYNFQPNPRVRTITLFSKIQILHYKGQNPKIANCHHFVRGPALGFICRVWDLKRVLNSNFQSNPRVRTITLFSKIEIFFIR